jgi:hypothetical protein
MAARFVLRAVVAGWHALRRRAGPPAGPDRAVGPAGRLRCDARAGVAPPNSRRNAGPSQVSASPSGGRPRAVRPWGPHVCSPAVRCARTTAASQLTKRAARADPDAALLAALKRPRGRACAAAAGSGDRAEYKSRWVHAYPAIAPTDRPTAVVLPMAAIVSRDYPPHKWRDVLTAVAAAQMPPRRRVWCFLRKVIIMPSGLRAWLLSWMTASSALRAGTDELRSIAPSIKADPVHRRAYGEHHRPARRISLRRGHV